MGDLDDRDADRVRRRQHRFLIVYGILLFLCPAYAFGFVFVGTLPVAAWIVLALKSGGGGMLGVQIGAWAAVEAVMAFVVGTLAVRASASTRRAMWLLGALLALIAAAQPIYCYDEGVSRSVGACANAVAALWSTL